jgi:hypothetical protein
MADSHEKPDEPIRIASDKDIAEMEKVRETFAKHQRDQQRLAKLDADLPEWVDKPDTIHLSLEDEGVAEVSDAPPEDEDEPPFDSRARQHPITSQTRKKIEEQGKWGTDWPAKDSLADLSPEEARFLESDLAKEVAASPEFREIVAGQQIAGGVFKHVTDRMAGRSSLGSADGGARSPQPPWFPSDRQRGEQPPPKQEPTLGENSPNQNFGFLLSCFSWRAEFKFLSFSRCSHSERESGTCSWGWPLSRC